MVHLRGHDQTRRVHCSSPVYFRGEESHQTQPRVPTPYHRFENGDAPVFPDPYGFPYTQAPRHREGHQGLPLEFSRGWPQEGPGEIRSSSLFRSCMLQPELRIPSQTWVNAPASTPVTTNSSPQPPEPGVPANKFQDASQHHAPHSLATPAPSGTNTPNNFGQPELMSNMLIDPRWVQSHGDRVGLMTGHYVGGGALPSPGPQSHITSADVNHDDPTTNPFPELEFIASPGHVIWC